ADDGAAALQRGAPQGVDDLVDRAVRDLDQGEAVGDLDRAHVAAGQARLAGDRADQVLRPDARRAARAHEQPGHAAGRRAPAAAGLAAPTAAVGVADADPPVGVRAIVAGRLARLAQGDVGDLLVVVLPDGRRLVGELDRGQRDLHRVEL